MPSNLLPTLITKKATFLTDLYNKWPGREKLDLPSSGREEPPEGFPILELSVKNPDGGSKKWLPYQEALKEYGIETITLRRIMPDEISADCDNVDTEELIKYLVSLKIGFTHWTTTPDRPYDHAHLRFSVKELAEQLPTIRKLIKEKIIRSLMDKQGRTPDLCCAYPCRMISVEYGKHHKRDEYLHLIKEYPGKELELTDEVIEDAKRTEERIGKINIMSKGTNVIRVKWDCPVVEDIIGKGREADGVHRSCLILGAWCNNKYMTKEDAIAFVQEWDKKNTNPEPPEQLINQVGLAYENGTTHITCDWLRRQGFCKVKDCEHEKQNKEAFIQVLKLPEIYEEQHTEEVVEKYFDGKSFVSKRLGDEILQTNLLKTTMDNETIFSYQDGVWLPNGESIVKKEASKKLGEKNTSHRIAETIAYIKYNTFIDREEFNKDPYLLALENGVLNIKTKELKPHDPKYMINVKISLIYDPEAKCPKFEKFLSEVVDESDIQLIYELFGWCLVRNYEIQKMVMFLGEGANGKSTLLNTLKDFLGPGNVSNISPQNLSERTFSPAQLHRKLANLYNDVPDKSLRQTGILKQLCGQDSITAEQKFKNPFSFENYAKLLFSCNKLPISRDDTDAWFRRWAFVNFPNVFDEKNRDKGLLKKLTTLQELSGILNKALEGIARIEENGAFTNSESTIALREKYLRLADPVAAFCMDCVVEDVEASIPKSELYGHYVAYCKKNKLLIVSIDVFGKRIIMVATTESERLTINERRVMCWKGIMLKTGKLGAKPKDSKQQTL